MRNTAKLLLTGAFATLLTLDPAWLRTALQAQAPSQPQETPAAAQQPPAPATPVIRVTADLVSTDVIVRDAKGQFVSDLRQGNFELYEDGVKQDIVSFVLVHGGRTFNQVSVPVAAPQEGILIPRRRPTNDSSGRVFIIFIDDLHLDFRVTPKTRELLKKIAKDLIHDGDMFGIVTTGTSSIAQQLTYDKQILESAISRITGNSLKLSEIKSAAWSSKGPTEVRHRAHVAFETLNDLLKNLEQVQNRRKAVIYLSSGYDFNPMERTRTEERAAKQNMEVEQLSLDPFEIEQTSQGAFNEADLVYELTYVTRLANRANATLYPIDPRGLIAGQDIDEEINYQDWLDHVRETQMGLRMLAEETNGFAIVNQNDFDKGLKRIDSETSDYYLLGYYSSNPDPLRRNRKLEVKVVGRDRLELSHRQSYLLRNPAQK
jgi:VWFA-related protein